MKDLGEVTYILSIMIYRDRSKRLIRLSQDAYNDKILNWFNMQDSKKGLLPVSHDTTLSKKRCPLTPDEQDRIRVVHYALAIGSTMYDILCTRPDVSYTLSAVSMYKSNYGEACWKIAKKHPRVLEKN
jgi:hypothetical protein